MIVDSLIYKKYIAGPESVNELKRKDKLYQL